MANIQNILDTIRANASTEYQSRVPEAVQTTIQNVGNPILTYQAIQNEFLNALVNRIGLVVVQHKIAKNPLALLKKGTLPLGSDIQEIFTNMAKDTGYDATGSKLLTRTTPDVKAMYHSMNRQSQYPVTITKAQLKTAFTSYDKLESLLTSIVNSMYSGDNYDEFILMKNLFATAVKNNKVVKIAVPHIESDGGAKAFVKAVKKTSSLFEFPSVAFNKYWENKPTHDKGKAITTWTPLENQIFIVRADVMDEIDVEVLASAFNIGKTEFLAKTLKVDSFGSETNVLGFLCDESFVQVYDELFETSEFYNSQGLYWNYWLNHWQTYSASLFANAVAFTCDSETISLNSTSLTFTTTATQTLTATVTPLEAVTVWDSTDDSIATVVGGVVTPHANGTCYITAVNGDSTAICEVTVNIA